MLLSYTWVCLFFTASEVGSSIYLFVMVTFSILYKASRQMEFNFNSAISTRKMILQ